MVLQTGERGQALQVGAVLLFGLLIVLFTVWQAFVIPDQNERVEFSHNQDVQSDMVELRGDVISMSDSASPSSSSIELGTQFPTRLLFVNPTPATGTLRTTQIGNATLELNATGVENDVRQFWNGTDRTFDTESIEYTPDYRVFQGAPRTVYDNTVTYNVFDLEDGNTSTLSNQALVEDDTLNLLAVRGSFAETAIGSVTPAIQPVSTQSRGIAVEGDGGPIALNISTELDAASWETLLEQEGNVVGVNNISDTQVQILLDGTEEYELRMAKIGFGPGASDTDPAYITAVDGADEEIRTTENQTITVEVRDRFNVPKNDVNVTASVETAGAGSIVPVNATTDLNGQIDFEFRPNTNNLGNNETVELNFSATNPGVFVADGVTNVTVDLTTTVPVGAETFQIRWGSDDPNINKECDPQMKDYIQECTSSTGEFQNGVQLFVNVTNGSPDGIELGLFVTNETSTGIQGEKYREFDQSGSKRITINTPGSAFKTTLIAIAGGTTEVVSIEDTG